MNEEEKQNLIKDCEEEIEQLKGRINRTNYTGGCTKYLESCLKRQEIALNSLRAEPELWEIVNPGEGTYYNPHGPRDYEQVETLWYKTPPITLKSEWHSTQESLLPPEETPVLILMFNGEIRIGHLVWEYPSYEETFHAFQYWDCPYQDGQDWDWCDVIGWQPLPTPPKFNNKGRNND